MARCNPLASISVVVRYYYYYFFTAQGCWPYSEPTLLQSCLTRCSDPVLSSPGTCNGSEYHTVNVRKINLMKQNVSKRNVLRVGNTPVEELKEFVYLGSIVAEDEGNGEDTSNRLTRAKPGFRKSECHIKKKNQGI